MRVWCGGPPTEAPGSDCGNGLSGWRALADDSRGGRHHGRVGGPTGAQGTPEESRVFTAFGELMAGPVDRFGYVGSWGYQRDPDFTFLHVGARWYDPATGRFLQRDPMGVGGA